MRAFPEPDAGLLFKCKKESDTALISNLTVAAKVIYFLNRET
jgi:hypothetical protein